MVKIVLPDTNSGYNLAVINSDLQAIAAELNEKVLYRNCPTGEPNQMNNTLDMNGNHIINLPKPIGLSEPLRLQDVIDINSGEFVVPTAASQITVNPAGGITATDVQAALVELSTEAATEATNRQTADTTILTEVHRKENLVNSIASLRLVDKTIYSSVYVISYYAGIIGGDGHYSYDPTDTTSADNGGTVIVAADGGRWKLFSGARINVKNFGAKGDDTTDDTVAIQKALNTQLLVYFPAGDYHYTTLTMTAGGMCGDGIGQTILQCTNLTGVDTIVYTGTGSFGNIIPSFQDMTILGQGAKPDGHAIAFLPTSGELAFVYFQNVMIENFPSCIHFKAASSFKLLGCNFINYIVNGLNIENTFVADSGDSFISDCLFNTGRLNGNTNAIFHQSSGGLKISNTKINGCDNGYVLAWNQASSADLMFNNLSIENFTNFGMFFSRAAGSGQVGSITISNCEYLGPRCIGTDASGVIILITIMGCIFNITSTSGSGINFTNIAHFAIGPNVFQAAVGGVPFAISTSASCSNGRIYQQLYVGFDTAHQISNGSGTVTVQPAF